MSWRRFAEGAPVLAQLVRQRLHGRVAYLATTRADGAPRVHPVTPVVEEERLYVFMEPTSPKGADLHRDARYALHCGVEDASGGRGEALVRGRAQQVENPVLRDAAVGAASYPPEERYILFALGVDEVLVTRYGPEGPERERWRAAG